MPLVGQGVNKDMDIMHGLGIYGKNSSEAAFSVMCSLDDAVSFINNAFRHYPSKNNLSAILLYSYM